jgi:hypothetical protein
MREEGQQATRDIILPDEACVMRTYRYGATPPIPLQLTAADEQGQIGSRLPHFWLNAEQTRSSIDLCKQRFVLISPDLRWADAAARSSSDFAHLSQSADALALGPHGAALVRPDHVVGARWQALPNDPAGELARAIVALLGRSQEA